MGLTVYVCIQCQDIGGLTQVHGSSLALPEILSYLDMLESKDLPLHIRATCTTKEPAAELGK